MMINGSISEAGQSQSRGDDVEVMLYGLFSYSNEDLFGLDMVNTKVLAPSNKKCQVANDWV